MPGGSNPFPPSPFPPGMGIAPAGPRPPTRLEIEKARRKNLRDQTASLAASLINGAVGSGTVPLFDVDDKFIELAFEVSEAFFVKCAKILKEEEGETKA